MATILLTAVGTLVGGPLGGAIGALAGRQIDAALIGSPNRHGPRLKELAVTTSSYGQPIARHFGRMRSSGTVIWATDLVESSETSGGGKGKPKTTSYSYSASFAVALSSRPIRSVGKIWADGNLLRGAAGDLKTGGKIRIYTGHRDQEPDPLISAAQGSQAPAFRDLAYVVFEDLALGDFGNRIPALTFEILADEEGPISLADIAPGVNSTGTSGQLPALLGFTDEGGEMAGTLGVINQVFDLVSVTDGNGLALSRAVFDPAEASLLPEEIIVRENRGSESTHGGERSRAAHAASLPFALRYYDRARDYQIAVQRALGTLSNGQERTIDFPAALSAEDARKLSLTMAQQARWRKDQMNWRIAELDPKLAPGRIVQIKDHPGYWLISSWEWLDRGVELGLDRIAPTGISSLQADSGTSLPPIDLPLTQSQLWTFELPLDDSGTKSSGSYFAALSADGAGWTGASLYLEQSGSLLQIGNMSRARSVAGRLVAALAPSKASYLEQNSAIEIDLIASDLGFNSTTVAGLAIGANRLLVGQEVVQFLNAEQLTETRWKLSGLLRGRGGTEHLAAKGHPAGSQAILLDETLRPLDPNLVSANPSTIMAIGLGDDQPVESLLLPSGISLNPPAPVHPRKTVLANGDWNLSWTRRGRGQWRWLDLVETPLVEEQEFYEVGLGSVEAPFATWTSSSPTIVIDASAAAQLLEAHGPAPLWVRQIGTYGKSPATFIAELV